MMQHHHQLDQWLAGGGVGGVLRRPSPRPAPLSSRRRCPCCGRTLTPSTSPTMSLSATSPTSASSASSLWTRTRRRRLRYSGAPSTPATAWTPCSRTWPS
uniref:Uncharacterized protein n=1 Tax=Triticum urartu TaxID=4572 RepID=A0A8R7V4P1_TRIUA